PSKEEDNGKNNNIFSKLFELFHSIIMTQNQELIEDLPDEFQVHRVAGRFINFNVQSVENSRSLRDLNLQWHLGQKMLNDQFFIRANNRVQWSGHANITLIRGPSIQNSRVSSRNM